MSTKSKQANRIRVKVFVDFWNFQLSIKHLDAGFSVDWRKMGRIVAEESLKIVDPYAALGYQGINVYGSYDPSNENDEPLRR